LPNRTRLVAEAGRRVVALADARDARLAAAHAARVAGAWGVRFGRAIAVRNHRESRRRAATRVQRRWRAFIHRELWLRYAKVFCRLRDFSCAPRPSCVL
jgi:hypothetical protein